MGGATFLDFLTPLHVHDWLVLLFGFGTTGLAVYQIARKKSRNHGPLLVGLLAAMFLIAVAGMCFARYAGVRGVCYNPPYDVEIFNLGEALSHGVLYLGAVLCAFNAVLVGLAVQIRHQRQSARKEP